ncbi:hypothetical protein Thiowin_00654 [Thiorhodovibrio winogradskyi]|uniref:Uncharacterized protein n=1 Tax=Thiorhodovibrio winogradskyi TaxID=77007 RepID=A0ABZ0S3P8_9GAMM
MTSEAAIDQLIKQMRDIQAQSGLRAEMEASLVISDASEGGQLKWKWQWIHRITSRQSRKRS